MRGISSRQFRKGDSLRSCDFLLDVLTSHILGQYKTGGHTMSKEAVFTMKVACDEYFARKVEAGRASMQAGQGRSNEEVEAEFAARRAAASQS